MIITKIKKTWYGDENDGKIYGFYLEGKTNKISNKKIRLDTSYKLGYQVNMSVGMLNKKLKEKFNGFYHQHLKTILFNNKKDRNNAIEWYKSLLLARTLESNKLKCEF
jgi:hypothetical protein